MRGLLAGMLLSATPLLSAVAQPTMIKGAATGLSSPTRVIDLSGSALTNRAAIGDALAVSQGISFSGALYFEAGDAFNLFGGPAVWNGLATDVSPVITMSFARPVLGVAFNVFAQTFSSTVRVRFESVSEGFGLTSFQDFPQDPSGVAPGAPLPPLAWWGFEGALISSVSVFAPATGNPADVWALGLANITVQDQQPATVPEPVALGLLASGAVALLVSRRRRRR